MKLFLLVSIAAVAAVGYIYTRPDTPANREFASPKSLPAIQAPELKESSGVAPSREEKDVFWTHNDSGDSARLFKFDTAGKLLGTIPVGDAKAIDWEDIASAKLDGRPYLFVGDIGDNSARRKTITVYRVPETKGALKADQSYSLVYPDRPHNAESLMVHPSTGDLYIVTKSSEAPSAVYKLDRPRKSGTYSLKKIGEISVGGSLSPARLITAGDISPDGRYVVVRTYMSAYEFPAPRNFDDWVKSKPSKVKTNLDIVGEGICYTTDGKSLITTAETTPCPVSRITVK